MHPPVTFVASHAELGGQERYLLTLLRSLPPGAVRGLVVLEDGPAVPALAAAAPRTWVVPTGARLGVLAAAVRLRRLLASAELVHADGIKAALCAALGLTGRDVPIVWMKHDGSLDGPLARAVAARCTAVVGVSETVLETFAGLRGPELRVVRNGVPPYDADRAAAARALRAELGGGDAVVLQVGRIVANKGQLDTVEAAAAVLRGRPGTRFAFVGEPDRHAPGYAEEVRERARALGIAHAVAFLGYREDAVTLIAGADVVVAPSRRRPGFYGWREGFGLVAAEAMAVGTPVVAYEDPALAETLAGCGTLVPAGDAAALARAVAALLGDRGRRAALAECGRRRARELSLDAAVAGLREAYRSASRARSGAGSARP